MIGNLPADGRNGRQSRQPLPATDRNSRNHRTSLRPFNLGMSTQKSPAAPLNYPPMFISYTYTALECSLRYVLSNNDSEGNFACNTAVAIVLPGF